MSWPDKEKKIWNMIPKNATIVDDFRVEAYVELNRLSEYYSDRF